ncbi:MAG: cell division protein ZapA [Acetomicrobium flavidum]|nr:cell division protein ZapA [Acetomicrobium flavidum]
MISVSEDRYQKTIEVTLGGKRYPVKTSLDEKTMDSVLEVLKDAFSRTPHRLSQEERLLLTALHLCYDIVSLEQRLQKALKDAEGK